MEFVERWPLFLVQKKLYTIGGRESVWVLFDHVAFDHSYRGLTALYQEIKRLERTCLLEGITGWVTAVNKWNHCAARGLEMLGARPYGDDPDFWYFYRVANLRTYPKSMRAAVTAWKESLHGRPGSPRSQRTH